MRMPQFFSTSISDQHRDYRVPLAYNYSQRVNGMFTETDKTLIRLHTSSFTAEKADINHCFSYLLIYSLRFFFANLYTFNKNVETN